MSESLFVPELDETDSEVIGYAYEGVDVDSDLFEVTVWPILQEVVIDASPKIGEDDLPEGIVKAIAMCPERLDVMIAVLTEARRLLIAGEET